MNIDTKTALRLSRIINASRERVFQAWTTPEELKLWSAPEGIDLADCSVDLKVGGAYRLRIPAGGGNGGYARTTRELVRPVSVAWFTVHVAPGVPSAPPSPA